MSNSITNLKDYFSQHNGLQRDNRYRVTFYGLNLPGARSDGDEYFTNDVTIGARAVDAVADNLAGFGPGRIIPRSIKFGGGVLMTFPVTNDSHILTLFDSWFNSIYTGSYSGTGTVTSGYAGNSFKVNFYDNIVTPVSMEVALLDPNGNYNSAFTFFEVFPLETVPIKLSMASKDTYCMLQVLFNYREVVYTFNDTGLSFI